MHIAIVTISDRASWGEYADISGPAIEDWLKAAIVSPCRITRSIIPDGVDSVRPQRESKLGSALGNLFS